MKFASFIYSGGLGNQIFQFLASKYLEKKYQNIKFYDCLGGNYQENSYRKFELNKLLVKEINPSEDFEFINNKIHIKFIDKLKLPGRIINTLSGIKLISESELIKNYLIDDPINKLSHKIDFYCKRKNKFKLKIIGNWQNPKSYINELEKMQSYFKDKELKLPNYAKNASYICIHIRRGDYLIDRAHIQGAYSKFSIIKFVLNALNILPSDYESLPILITTDDPKWTNSWINIIGKKFNKEIIVCNNNDTVTDWNINKNAVLNIISNSTFSYTAALLNNKNRDNKLRCILPQWYRTEESAFEKGWTIPNGFLESIAELPKIISNGEQL